MTARIIKNLIFYVIFITLLTALTSTVLLLIYVKNPTTLIKKDSRSTANLPKDTQPDYGVKDRNMSLNLIFDKKPDWLKDLPESKTSILIATGDVMPGRSVNYSTVKSGNFNWPFLNMSELLRSSDITIINLEGTLLEKCSLTNEGMKFCGDTRLAESLKSAGIDIANLANNHSADYGYEGMSETKTVLENSGITTVGLGDTVFKSVKGKTFGFLSYNSIFPHVSYVSQTNEKNIISDIENIKQKTDVIVVSFHWGNEYTITPTDEQIRIAHYAIDTGADLVLGHHPHWIQPIEIYKGKPIFYSLGNFVFDQMWSQKTKEGIVVKFTFYEDTIVDIELIPVLIENYGQPGTLSSPEKELLMKEIEAFSVLHKSKQP